MMPVVRRVLSVLSFFSSFLLPLHLLRAPQACPYPPGAAALPLLSLLSIAQLSVKWVLTGPQGASRLYHACQPVSMTRCLRLSGAHGKVLGNIRCYPEYFRIRTQQYPFQFLAGKAFWEAFFPIF